MYSAADESAFDHEIDNVLDDLLGSDNEDANDSKRTHSASLRKKPHHSATATARKATTSSSLSNSTSSDSSLISSMRPASRPPPTTRTFSTPSPFADRPPPPTKKQTNAPNSKDSSNSNSSSSGVPPAAALDDHLFGFNKKKKKSAADSLPESLGFEPSRSGAALSVAAGDTESDTSTIRPPATVTSHRTLSPQTAAAAAPSSTDSPLAVSAEDRRARYRELMKKKREERTSIHEGNTTDTGTSSVGLTSVPAPTTATNMTAADPFDNLENPLNDIIEVNKTFSIEPKPTQQAASTIPKSTFAEEPVVRSQRPGRRAIPLTSYVDNNATAPPQTPFSAPPSQSQTSIKTKTQLQSATSAVPTPTPQQRPQSVTIDTWYEWLGLSATDSNDQQLLPIAKAALSKALPTHWKLTSDGYLNTSDGKRRYAHPRLQYWKKKVSEKRLALRYGIDESETYQSADEQSEQEESATVVPGKILDTGLKTLLPLPTGYVAPSPQPSAAASSTTASITQPSLTSAQADNVPAVSTLLLPSLLPSQPVVITTIDPTALPSLDDIIITTKNKINRLNEMNSSSTSQLSQRQLLPIHIQQLAEQHSHNIPVISDLLSHINILNTLINDINNNKNIYLNELNFLSENNYNLLLEQRHRIITYYDHHCTLLSHDLNIERQTRDTREKRLLSLLSELEKRLLHADTEKEQAITAALNQAHQREEEGRKHSSELYNTQIEKLNQIHIEQINNLKKLNETEMNSLRTQFNDSHILRNLMISVERSVNNVQTLQESVTQHSHVSVNNIQDEIYQRSQLLKQQSDILEKQINNNELNNKKNEKDLLNLNNEKLNFNNEKLEFVKEKNLYKNEILLLKENINQERQLLMKERFTFETERETFRLIQQEHSLNKTLSQNISEQTLHTIRTNNSNIQEEWSLALNTLHEQQEELKIEQVLVSKKNLELVKNSNLLIQTQKQQEEIILMINKKYEELNHFNQQIMTKNEELDKKKESLEIEAKRLETLSQQIQQNNHNNPFMDEKEENLFLQQNNNNKNYRNKILLNKRQFYQQYNRIPLSIYAGKSPNKVVNNTMKSSLNMSLSSTTLSSSPSSSPPPAPHSTMEMKRLANVTMESESQIPLWRSRVNALRSAGSLPRNVQIASPEPPRLPISHSPLVRTVSSSTDPFTTMETSPHSSSPMSGDDGIAHYGMSRAHSFQLTAEQPSENAYD